MSYYLCVVAGVRTVEEEGGENEERTASFLAQQGALGCGIRYEGKA
jgi:hypothetical protein